MADVAADSEAAPAKLNLALHVRARRADGYHELETLFAFCRDGDSVRLEPAEAASFRVEGPFAAGLAGGDNLVLRAVRGFAEAYGDPGPLAITLTKRLPVASGLGGGSADAAATLRLLARRAGVDAGDARLFAVAAALGSDVPACLLGRAAIGRGRGEALTPLDGVAAWPVLLVNPGVPVATGPVFAGWDRVDRGPLGEGAPLDVALAGRNDLEAPAVGIAPAIGEVLAALGETAPMLARMSGSGATCFALYRTEAARVAAAAAIAAARPGWWRLETALA